MPRLTLGDEHWSKLRIIMRKERIYDKLDLRWVVEGIFYRLRVGCPWRDLPSDFGDWNSVYKRFNDWSSKGKLLRFFRRLATVGEGRPRKYAWPSMGLDYRPYLLLQADRLMIAQRRQP